MTELQIHCQHVKHPDHLYYNSEVTQERYRAVETLYPGIYPFDINLAPQDTKRVSCGEYAICSANAKPPHMEKVCIDVGILAKAYNSEGKLTHCGVALQGSENLDLARDFFQKMRETAGNDARIEIFFAGGTTRYLYEHGVDERRYDAITTAAEIRRVVICDNKFDFWEDFQENVNGANFNFSSTVDAMWFDEQLNPHMNMRVKATQIKT